METLRGHHEGSLFLRRKDRRWTAQVTMPDGRRPTASCQHPDHGPTEKRPCPEGKALLAELLRLRDAGAVHASPRLTLAAYLDRWLGDVRGSLAPATWRKHESIVRTGLAPALGARRLSELSVGDVRRYLAQGSLGARSLGHHRATLRRALADAVREGLIVRNVAALAPPPKLPQREPAILSADQARSLIDGTREERHGPLFHVAVTTGMREAELLGLAWRDVDLDAAEIHARNTLHREEGEWVLREPKTSKSRRTIPLTPGAVGALREHRRRQLEERVGSGGRYPAFGLVFTTRTGWPMYAWHVLEALYAAEKRLGLPRVGVHGLRHSTATILYAAGVDIETIADILGHSSSRVTAAIYRHRVGDMARGAADKMGAAVG